MIFAMFKCVSSAYPFIYIFSNMLMDKRYMLVWKSACKIFLSRYLDKHKGYLLYLCNLKEKAVTLLPERMHSVFY